MRGTADPRQEGLFSYVSPEARVPKDHPLRPIREMVNRALKELSGEFEAMCSHRAAVDCVGAVVAGGAGTGSLLDSQRTAFGGATGLQSFVPLVCRAVDGRPDVGPLYVHEEPGAVDRLGHRP